MRKIAKCFATVLTIMVVLPIQSFGQDIYRLHILDCTNSMTSSFGGGTRYHEALKKIKENITEDVGAYDALWVIDGPNSGEVQGFTQTTSLVLNAIDAQEPWGNYTDLADVMCKAMEALEEVGQSGDYKALFLVTDGEENYSGKVGEPTVCSNGIDSDNPNVFPFEVNALRVFPDGIVDNGDRQAWAPMDTIIPSEYGGRAYELQNGNVFDWAAGVLLASWEWNMYYRVARGPLGIPENKGSPALGVGKMRKSLGRLHL